MGKWIGYTTVGCEYEWIDIDHMEDGVSVSLGIKLGGIFKIMG